jgi:DNA-binding MarR family transcriptional regulator
MLLGFRRGRCHCVHFGLSRMFKNWPEVESAWADPGEQGSNLKTNEFLTFHLLRLGSIAKGCVTREYLDPAGLSVPEWRLLATTVTFSPIAFADIVSMSTMDKGQVSRTLRSAQAKGLVTADLVQSERRPNEPDAPTNSRIEVRITPAGREIYEKVMPVAQRYQLGLLELMTPEERRVMLGVLQRLYRHMVAGSSQT